MRASRLLGVNLLAACLGSAVPALGQNLLTNPGFETGNLSGWTATGLFTNAVKQDGQALSATPPYSTDLTNVRTGAYVYAVGFNGSSASAVQLSQAVATTAGQTYLVGMYASSGATAPLIPGVTPTFSLDSVTVALPSTSIANGTLPSNFTMIRTLVTATTSNALFAASLRSSENGTQNFDDFFVEAFAVSANPYGRSQIRVSQNDSAAGNGTFFKPGAFQQNANTDLVFYSTLNNTSTQDGIFKITSGNLIELARKGDNAPLAAGQFGMFGLPQINASGQTLFWSRLTGTSGGSANDDRMYHNTGTGLTEIAFESGLPPDSNGLFGPLSWTGAAPQQINSQGRAMFYANFTGSPASQLDGYLYWNAGTTSYVTRRGYSVPGPAGWSHGVASTPRLSDSGHVYWSTAITDGVNTGSALMRYNGLSHSLIARDGHAAPGNGTYVNFGAVGPVNVANEFGFTATLAGTTGGTTDDFRLYLHRTSGIVQLASEGQLAPDSNGSYVAFTPASINNFGQLAFIATLTGSSSTSGIFRSEPDLSITQIVRAGDAAPEGNGVFAGFSNPEIGLGGQIAFAALIAGSNESPIYIGDDREILLVARFGFEADGKVALNATGHTRPNVHGQLSYRSDLADGTSAILTYTPRLTWMGGATGSWNTNADWTLRINPAAVHDVQVSNDSTLLVTGPTFHKTVRSLQIGSASGSATLQLLPSVILTAMQGTTITAHGALTGTGFLGGNVTNAGTIAPGTSPGTLTIIGDLTSTGLLEFELASLASFDRLVVEDASLGGTVQVVLLGSFSPSAGDGFDIMDWSGSFADLGYAFDLSLAPLAPGLGWDTSLFATAGIISVTLVPEPAALGTMLGGALLLTRRRRWA